MASSDERRVEGLLGRCILAPDGTVRLTDLTPVSLNGGWRYDVTDTVPDPDGIYRYHVRVIDPRDRVSDSPALMEVVEEA